MDTTYANEYPAAKPPLEAWRSVSFQVNAGMDANARGLGRLQSAITADKFRGGLQVPPELPRNSPMLMSQPLVRFTTAAVIIVASACGSSSHESTSPQLPSTHLVGQVMLGNGATSAPALRVTVRATNAPARNASTVVDATGTFDFFAPIESWDAASIDLIVDAPSGVQRTFHPTLAHLPSDTAGVVARPFLIPETVTFTSKTFGSSTVSFSTRAAFTAVCTDTTNANCNSFYPKSWLIAAPHLWPEAALPIPVAFNRAGSSADITASDSIALWTNISQMQDALGRQLFTPATLSSLGAPDDQGYLSGAVLISIDNTLSATAGYTNWNWNGSGAVFESKTRVGSAAALASRGLVTHELLHALGFHHTCAWPSVMGGYGCALLSGPTVQDAGAFTLAWTLRQTMLADQPTTSLADALDGEQQLETSLIASRVPSPLGAPIPYAPAERRAVMAGGRLVMTDGAP
jgi:hypothetical protein